VAKAKEEQQETIDFEELARQREKRIAFEQGRSEELLRQLSELSRPKPYGLAAKLAAVQLELEDVPRQGHADVYRKNDRNEWTLAYSYDYILEADLMKAIRPLLAKHGIATLYSDRIVKGPTKEDVGTTVEVTLTFFDGESGERESISGEGYAIDRGDKGANKAKTSAMRYLLWKSFLQPSDEDPEQQAEDRQQVEAAKDATERQRAAREGGRTQRDRGDRRPQLRERISQLAVELDEVQGANPGETLGAILAELGVPIEGLEEAYLVTLATKLSEHVAEQRALAESGDPATDRFVLPEQGSLGV
jgi:hypothetical protein